MCDVMMLVLVGGVVAFAVGAGLIKVSHYYSVRRSNALARFVLVDVKKLVDDYTDNLMKKTVDMTAEMAKKMQDC